MCNEWLIVDNGDGTCELQFTSLVADDLDVVEGPMPTEEADILLKSRFNRHEIDGQYAGVPCTCKVDCPSVCKGECGCQACRDAYFDSIEWS